MVEPGCATLQSDPRAPVLYRETTLSFIILHYPAIVCLLCLPGLVRVPAGKVGLMAKLIQSAT